MSDPLHNAGSPHSAGSDAPRERSLNLVIQDALTRRIQWASLHWGTEDVSRDAWPHLADAVADAVNPLMDKARDDALAVARDLLSKVLDYWDGRPLTHHGDHIHQDLCDVLRAITPVDATVTTPVRSDSVGPPE